MNGNLEGMGTFIFSRYCLWKRIYRSKVSMHGIRSLRTMLDNGSRAIQRILEPNTVSTFRDSIKLLFSD